jgi:two-component system, sensor histidine kinase and response regulator
MEQRDGSVVLVAEDDIDMARFLQRNLTREGYKPTVVNSGLEALRIVQSVQPEIIILDVDLPGADGFTVCRQLKNDERTADIPVIFLTGKQDMSDKVTGLDIGAQDYLVKPFDMPELHARLRRIRREHQQLEDARSQVELQQSNFLGILNHELRAPLTVINTASQLLAENHQLSEQRHDQLVKSIRESTKTLTQIIEDLLYLAHPVRHLKTTNIRPILQAVIEESRQRINDYGLFLSARIPPTLPSMVIDDIQLRRILFHLIDNAVKFTPRNGVITFTVALGQGGSIVATEPGAEADIVSSTPPGLLPDDDRMWIVLAIRDTGIGIAPEYHRRVFEPFFQIDSTSTRTAQGLGLGLAVVASFVRAHHGHLAVRSGDGSGTAFHIALPLSQSADSRYSTSPGPDDGPESA